MVTLDCEIVCNFTRTKTNPSFNFPISGGLPPGPELVVDSAAEDDIQLGQIGAAAVEELPDPQTAPLADAVRDRAADFGVFGGVAAAVAAASGGTGAVRATQRR